MVRKTKKLLALLISVMMLLSVMSMTNVLATGSASQINSIPDDAVEFNGHYYKLYKSVLDWNESQDFCESVGGHLATISSAEENGIIKTLMANDGYGHSYWLGAYKSGDSFYWIDNTPFSYTNWSSNQPDNSGDMQVYLRIYGRVDMHGEWDDYENSTFCMDGFICEWDVFQEILSFESSSYKFKLNEANSVNPKLSYTAKDEETITSFNVSSIAWTVADSSIAQLNTAGAMYSKSEKTLTVQPIIKPLKAGETTLTATLPNGKTASTKIVVEGKGEVKFDKTEYKFYKGQGSREIAITYTAGNEQTITDLNINEIKWSVASSSIATISSSQPLYSKSGNTLYVYPWIEANEEGKTTLSVTMPDGSTATTKIVVEKLESTINTHEPDDPSANCSCNCHKSGIEKFFWKLINSFHKLFGMEKYHYCDCGNPHW